MIRNFAIIFLIAFLFMKSITSASVDKDRLTEHQNSKNQLKYESKKFIFKLFFLHDLILMRFQNHYCFH